MNLIDRVKSWIYKPKDLPEITPTMTEPERDAVRKPMLTRGQAELVRELLCTEGKPPQDMAKAFYRRYPRASFRHLWDKDEHGIRYLTEPELFTEGCDLADTAMRVLGDIWEEDGKEYIRGDSPFLEIMRKAVMG